MICKVILHATLCNRYELISAFKVVEIVGENLDAERISEMATRYRLTFSLQDS